MTNDEKQLLFADLCARLPYQVNVLIDLEKTFDGGAIGELNTTTYINGEPHIYTKHDWTPVNMEEVRPYLRPMSRMTKEELEEFHRCEGTVRKMDFFYSHHIDCKFLIGKGLALLAPKVMYNQFWL